MFRMDSKKTIMTGILMMIVGFAITVVTVWCLLSRDGKNSDKVPTATPTVTVTPKPTPTKKPDIIWDDNKGGHIEGPNVTIDGSSGSTDEDIEDEEEYERYDKYITVEKDGSIKIDFDSYTEDMFGVKTEESE